MYFRVGPSQKEKDWKWGEQNRITRKNVYKNKRQVYFQAQKKGILRLDVRINWGKRKTTFSVRGLSVSMCFERF
jgi:hypothetical protein